MTIYRDTGWGRSGGVEKSSRGEGEGIKEVVEEWRRVVGEKGGAKHAEEEKSRMGVVEKDRRRGKVAVGFCEYAVGLNAANSPSNLFTGMDRIYRMR